MANQQPNGGQPGWEPEPPPLPGQRPASPQPFRQPPPGQYPPVPYGQPQYAPQSVAAVPPVREPRLVMSAAVIGWIMPLLVSLFTIIVVGLFVVIADYAPSWWWAPLLGMWLLGLSGTIVAALNREKRQPGQYSLVGVQIILGFVFSASSAVLMLVAGVVVAQITHLKTPEVQAQLKKQRQADLAARAKVLRSQQAAAEVERRKVAQETYEREEKAKYKAAQDDSDKAKRYAAAMVGRLKHGDDGTTIVRYEGNFIPWLEHECAYTGLEFTPTPDSRRLVESEQESNGFLVRKLSLPGASLVPKAIVTAGDEAHLYLLQRDGDLLQVSLSTWQVKQRLPMQGTCSDIETNLGSLLIARSNPGAIIHYTPRAGFSPRGTQTPIAQPERIAGYGGGDEREVLTGGREPLWACLPNSGRRIEFVHKLDDVEPNTIEAQYAPAQIMRPTPINNQGQFLIARKDGVYRGQLPRHGGQFVERWGYIQPDQKHFRAGNSGYELQSLEWKPIVRGQGLNPETFATYAVDEVASSTAQKNLVLYDRDGQLKASWTWPMAGKTLAISSLPASRAIVVFTERSTFVLTPSVGGVANTTPAGTTPGGITAGGGAKPKYVKSYLLGSFTPVPIEPEPFKLEWQDERAPGGQMVKNFGRTQPGSFLFNPRGSELWMLRYGVLHRINQTNWTADLARTLELNAGFEHLHFTRAGLVAVKGNLGAEAIYVIDPTTLHVKHVWNTSVERSSPFGTHADFAAARDGQLVAFLLNSGESCDVMDLTKGGVIASISSTDVPGQGKVPKPIYGIAISPDGKSLVLATNRVHRYDISPTGVKHAQMSEPVIGSTLALSISGNSQRLLRHGQDPSRVYELMNLDNELGQMKIRESGTPRLDPTGEFIWLGNGEKYTIAGEKVQDYQLEPLNGGEQYIFAGNGEKLFFGEFLIEQK